MSKEYMQALDDLFGLVAFRGSFEKAQKYFDIIEEALGRLKAIDNTNPSEALECLRENRNHSLPSSMPMLKWEDNFKIVEQYILKAQELENRVNIETESKQNIIKHNFALQKENAKYKRSLNIIFEKNVDMWNLRVSKTVEQYNSTITNYEEFKNCKLTQEEFDLLREDKSE